MRILHVLDHSLPLHSGYSFRTAAILREQHRLGWQTAQITSAKQGNDTVAPETHAGVVYERSPPLPAWLERLPVVNQLGVIRWLATSVESLARRFTPDIIHAHSSALNGLAALRVARRMRLPLVYELRAFWEDAAVDHGTTSEGSLRYRLSRALETRVVRRASAVTTICEGIRGDLRQRGLATEKVTVIPNSVDLEKFQRAPRKDAALAAELGLADSLVLGFIGSFYAYEGLDLLLEALPEILRQQEKVKLLLVGGGFQEQALHETVQARGLAEDVVFTGRVPHEEVTRYYDLMDLLVYPRHSMRLTELVTPLKPLEAMAQRRLVVASDVGGHRELIEDGRTGTLFKAGDAGSLARAVLDLLAHPDSWAARLDAAREWVATQRSWPATVARYESVYTSLLTA